LPLNLSVVSSLGGSGIPGAFVAPRKSGGFDVFAADGCSFFWLNPSSQQWSRLSPGGNNGCGGATSLHADTWAMAFASTYDPAAGDCNAYLTNDGGIYMNTLTFEGARTECTLNGPITSWALASDGLDGLFV